MVSLIHLSTMVLGVIGMASSNPLNPTWLYCADVSINIDLPPATFFYGVFPTFSNASCTIDAKLYYNDDSDWQLRDWDFDFNWYFYNTNDLSQPVDTFNVSYTDNNIVYDNTNLYEDFDLFFNYGFIESTGVVYFEIYQGLSQSVLVYDVYTLSFTPLFMDCNVDMRLIGYELNAQITDFINIDYSDAYNEGYNTGYSNGFDDGNNNGYQNGYNVGYNEGSTQNETAVAIFSGIISIALIPINFFLACLNFEVFGINIGAFVSALLTVAIVVIITRMIVSGGNGGDK